VYSSCSALTFSILSFAVAMMSPLNNDRKAVCVGLSWFLYENADAKIVRARWAIGRVVKGFRRLDVLVQISAGQSGMPL
jgi:hypothetical protein